MWERKFDSKGVARWVLQKTVELEKILGLWFWSGKEMTTTILRYAEEVHTIIIILREMTTIVHSSIFMVQLDSMQSRQLRDFVHSYYPFTSFFTERHKVGNYLIFHTWLLE